MERLDQGQQPELSVEDYCEELGERVRALILQIQREEFGVQIGLAEQPDLLNIEEFYKGFWVVRDGEMVVGTIGLLDIGEGFGVIRKMFVDADYRGRGRGIALKLLRHLLEQARSGGMEAIYLGTTEAFKAAQRFYAREGFEEITADELPESFPRMAVDSRFYRMAL